MAGYTWFGPGLGVIFSGSLWDWFGNDRDLVGVGYFSTVNAV
jgi:hypothetical protein